MRDYCFRVLNTMRAKYHIRRGESLIRSSLKTRELARSHARKALTLLNINIERSLTLASVHPIGGAGSSVAPADSSPTQNGTPASSSKNVNGVTH